MGLLINLIMAIILQYIIYAAINYISTPSNQASSGSSALSAGVEKLYSKERLIVETRGIDHWK